MKTKYLFYILSIFLLSGCGAGKMLDRGTDKLKGFLNSGMSKEDIIDIVKANSNTGEALSIWVYGGAAMFGVGAIMLAFGMTRRTGIILMGLGALASFAAYAIEEYAMYAILVGVFLGSCYGCLEFGLKIGEKLGFEKGKDHTEAKTANSLFQNEASENLTK